MNHPDPDAVTDWLADDALAPELTVLLRTIGRDAIPLILDSARAFESWADDNRRWTDELPRGVGMHRTALAGVSFERLTTPYTLWMVQRCRAVHGALGAADRRTVDRALAGTGCEALFLYTPRHEVGRRPFRLFLEPGRPGLN
jgi:hypothetical protein